MLKVVVFHSKFTSALRYCLSLGDSLQIFLQIWGGANKLDVVFDQTCLQIGNEAKVLFCYLPFENRHEDTFIVQKKAVLIFPDLITKRHP